MKDEETEVKRRVIRVSFKLEYDDGGATDGVMAGEDLKVFVEWFRPTERVQVSALQELIRPGPITTLVLRVEHQEK